MAGMKKPLRVLCPQTKKEELWEFQASPAYGGVNIAV